MKEGSKQQKFYHRLYFYVILAIIAGIIAGTISPTYAKETKILSDIFIMLIKTVIFPLVFLTVTLGIAGLQDLKKAGRLGLKSISYFLTITLFALTIGLIVVNITQPGEGIDYSHIQERSQLKKPEPQVPILMYILLFALLTGIALASLKDQVKNIVSFLESALKIVFRIVSYIMYFAPLGAFGAMAFSIGTLGMDYLKATFFLMANVYATCLLFIFLILGLVAKLSGFSIWKFLKYIKNEILLVLGTSSSESALPHMMEKLERLGCSRAVTKFVIPTGYSFNLDGTCIYLTMATLFLAQASNTMLGLGEQLTLLGTLMLLSKGAAAVTGGGLVTLYATLESTDIIPHAALFLLIGIDRFMSEARAITNLIGNGVATVVISNWEKETDLEKLRSELK